MDEEETAAEMLFIKLVIATLEALPLIIKTWEKFRNYLKTRKVKEQKKIPARKVHNPLVDDICRRHMQQVFTFSAARRYRRLNQR